MVTIFATQPLGHPVVADLKKRENVLKAIRCIEINILFTDYDSLMATNKQQAEEIKRLKTLSNNLESRVAKEGQKVESLEQYGRKLI